MLTASNAGHEYPIIRHPGGSFEVLKDKHSFVVGAIPDTCYLDYTLMLEPGSRLFVYTDGVPEATSANDELFGLKRTLDALNENNDGHPQDIIESVKLAVQRFVGTAPQFDDLTMMCIAYNGPQAGENQDAEAE